MFWSEFLTKGKPLVSVIVPTKNSEATIGKCLESVENQTYASIEVIVVDNHSKDQTRQIAQNYNAQVFLKGNERASQVNFGVKKAKGEYVYRVDSDFVLEPLVVEEAVDKCESQGYDAVAVHNTSDPTVSFWSKVRKLERDCYKGDELNVGARFLRRKVFETVGGFDETLVAAEDYDLHNKLVGNGFMIGQIEAQEIHIGEPQTLGEIVRKHYYYGKTISNYIKKNPDRAKRQLGPVRLGYIRNRSHFLRNPTCALGFLVYQFVRYFAAIIGLLTVKLGV